MIMFENTGQKSTPKF